jgi:hypothetical protein
MSTRWLSSVSQGNFSRVEAEQNSEIESALLTTLEAAQVEIMQGRLTINFRQRQAGNRQPG